MGFDQIELISQTYTIDELGQRIPQESAHCVYGRVESVSQKEFYEAARSGLKAEYKVILSFAEDYDGQEIAVLGSKRYAIYRTYVTKSGQIELYLRNENGVTHDVVGE